MHDEHALHDAGDARAHRCGFRRSSERGRSRPHGPARAGPLPGGQTAFEDYRTETLQRLDREQAEFHDFLGRLRGAKDKAEFEKFMAERRRPPPA